jgi:hypothetical protein
MRQFRLQSIELNTVLANAARHPVTTITIPTERDNKKVRWILSSMFFKTGSKSLEGRGWTRCPARDYPFNSASIWPLSMQ